MKLADFREAGDWPTLVCAFTYFSVSCMVWMLIGAMGNSLAADFGLSPHQKGLMVAFPILGGALLRIVVGLITDRIGPRSTALAGLAITTVPLLLGWLWVSSFAQLLVVGLLLGVAGASFATALPMASRWYPPGYQGLALGIAGAGNGGTAIATFFGPRLTLAWGWPAVFGLSLVPVAATFVLVWLVARDAPSQPPPRPLRDYLVPLATGDGWWFCLFYAVTFGGFVGLAAFLNIFFHDHYGLSQVSAGSFSTLCVIAGSLIRPAGGYLADRHGGIRILLAIYLGIAGTMLAMSMLPSLTWGTALLFVGMSLLGMGNGAVFQLVPQRFPREIGVMTGLVGAAGGIGGFILPTMFGGLMHRTGTFAGGFVLFGLAALVCATCLAIVSQAWENQFVAHGGLAADSPDFEPAPAGEEVLSAQGAVP